MHTSSVTYLRVKWSNAWVIRSLPWIFNRRIKLASLPESAPTLSLFNHVARYIQHLGVVNEKPSSKMPRCQVYETTPVGSLSSRSPCSFFLFKCILWLPQPFDTSPDIFLCIITGVHSCSCTFYELCACIPDVYNGFAICLHN